MPQTVATPFHETTQVTIISPTLQMGKQTEQRLNMLPKLTRGVRRLGMLIQFAVIPNPVPTT